jgi:hypothetical protein
MGMSGSWGGKSFSDPRICDMAAHVLWMRWPNKYRFDLAAPVAVRDQQLLQLKNIWRKERGLPALAPPEAVRITRMSEDELRPLWTSILQAANDSERAKAASAVEARGLGALPAARRLLDAVPKDSPLRPALERMVRRLSTMVREVAIETTELPDDHPLARALKASKGKPLGSAQFVELILAYTRQPLATIPGITLAVERAGDDTGIVIKLTRVKQRALQDGGQKGWQHNERISSGCEVLLGSSGSSSDDYGRKSDGYRDFAIALDTALDALPNEPLEAIISIVQEK